MKQKPDVVIAAAAPPRPQVLALSSQIKSAAMVPINGKPILGWILDKLVRGNFENQLILTPKNDKHIKNYVSNRHLPCDVNFCEVEQQDNPKGLGHSLLKGLRDQKSLNTEDILIVLGHTILNHESESQERDELKFDEDWVMYGVVQEEVSRWCYVETDKDSYVKNLDDKPLTRTLPDNALIGLYYFQDKDLLEQCLERTIEIENRRIGGAYQLSPALKEYNKARKIRAIRAESWLDCGSINGLNQSRKKLIATRSHNDIKVDTELGVLKKQSKRSVELHQEYSWYISIPKKLQGLAPRVIDYIPRKGEQKESSLELEYYGYHSLEEAWVYQDLQMEVWKSILNHLFVITERFREYRADLSPDSFSALYHKKTEERIEQLTRSKQQRDWEKLITYRTLYINSRKVDGWLSLKDSVFQRATALFEEEHCTIIHGDLHLANVLYDLDSRLVKLIDPRGSFGSAGIFGDCKYDLAKLRHSIRGGYNYIVNDLFEADDNGNRIDLYIPRSENQNAIANWFDDLISKDFDLDSIKLIEGLLFLSMLPLHADNEKRQLAMFAVGIDRLNEVINPDPSTSDANQNMSQISEDKRAEVITSVERDIAEVEITIEEEYQHFTPERQAKFFQKIRTAIEASPWEIYILEKREGSVKLRIALPYDLAEKLLWALKKGELGELRVTDVEIIGENAAKSIINHKRVNGHYDVFLCHNHENKAEVRKIGLRLKQHGILPWLDEWEIRPGETWVKALEEQIDSVKAAAVFIGDKKGPWHEIEIDAFIRQFGKRKCPVIPAILRSCKTVPEIPIIIGAFHLVDFRKRNPDPLLQLIWGITGARLDNT